jgi:hypothetical protein
VQLSSSKGAPSGVIRELDVFGTLLAPSKADPELIVDAYRPLAGAITVQRMKSMSRWDLEVVDEHRIVQPKQTAACHGD